MPTANLFIVGAPRSGTTSLAYWLGRHPEIVLARQKEPGYHATDLPMLGRVAEAGAYEALFSHATDERYLLDASPWYLYSVAAISGIASMVPDAHVIVSLRNPVEMLPSLHNLQVFKGLERERDLATALFTQRPPDPHDFRRAVDYIEVGRLGTHLERLLDHFPPERVHLVVFEHLAEHPQGTHVALLSDLGLAAIPLDDYRALNPSRRWRSSSVQRLANRIGTRFSTRWRRRIGGRLRRWNSVAHPIVVDSSIRQRIVDELGEDIDLLARLTGLDLDHWKAV